MGESMEWMKLAVMALGLVFNVAAYLYMRASNRDKATKEQIEKLEEDIADQTDRITKLETYSGSAPRHSDLSKMYDSLNTLSATVHQLVGENRGQSDTLKLILNQITAKGMK